MENLNKYYFLVVSYVYEHYPKCNSCDRCNLYHGYRSMPSHQPLSQAVSKQVSCKTKTTFIRYARGSSNYSDFLKRHLHLRNRLLDQGYKKIRLIRSLKKFIFRYQYLVEIYSASAEKIISDAFSYSENV